ncbi:MAG: DNA mismatch repair protein MutS [Candidatus Eisenbacteria bacterium]|nr:DNA mismatch repair protein MutS [Candidatus Eisenbacteria bacterium]
MSRETPMMEQYNRIKAEHLDAILLFRMGDFYETFFDDAKVTSRVLGLALTTRDKGSPNPVPLAGIPYHALDTYLARLVAAGHKVAICEQIEDPGKAKGLVKRAVTEVVTPGTIMSPSMLDEKRGNYLLAVRPGDDRVGLARIDLSTGEFQITEASPDELRREILRSDAAELLVPEDAPGREPLRSALSELSGVTVTGVPEWEFSSEEARRTLCEHFSVANLDGFGVAGLDAGVAAGGAALRYLRDLKKRDLDQVTSVRAVLESDRMILDETTQRNLELIEPLEHGLPEATLLAVLDRTVTPMGARLLREWILYPLVDTDAIRERHDAVEDFLRTEREALRSELGELCDVPRVVARAASGHATPRDMGALRSSLELLPAIRGTLTAFESGSVRSLADSIPDLSSEARFLREAIVDNPPVAVKTGGVVRAGYDAELDELRGIARDGKSWISRLQSTERERTGISNLKVGYNKVFGYYIEVTKANVERVPDDYVRKQTLVNAERYVTPELKEREGKILTAEEDMERLEAEIFDRVRARVAESAIALQGAAAALAELDVLSSLAETAAGNRYVRPQVDRSDVLDVSGGRHPVVERLLRDETFVPNDVRLDLEESQIILLTGPNMAGKSTYLRQTALIVIMAQLGSFVPADSARIGFVDRVFTRIGATDALARGRSTFLVEMSETANILRNATSRSLIVLDEIGRGTSTFDGLSLAWSVTEYLHDNENVRPRTMFATHYHELTELADVLARVRNMNILVRETGDSIAFLRKVAPGCADQSYGIEVAKLAGIPDDVIVRAREILDNLESARYTEESLPRLAEGSHGPLGDAGPQLQLFEREPSEIEREIAELDVDRMTPLDALGKLADLKKRTDRGEA